MTYLLEGHQRFSRSAIWEMQRRYFQTRGAEAWHDDDQVPYYITNNTYLARDYAQLAFAWLRDLVADGAVDRAEPIYIIELGAGAGRLAFLFLTKFFSFFRQSVLRDLQITYVLTDFPERTVHFWQQHPQLRPWVEQGALDFARFDAERDTTISLIESGRMLTSETLKNPALFIANYFFDSLPQDVFYVDKGRLYERLVSLHLPHPPDDPTEPALLGQVEYHYENREIGAVYYGDPELDAILDHYRASLTRAQFMLPIGGLECLKRLRELTNGRMAVLAADKGNTHADMVPVRGDVRIAVHGSVSILVNFDSIARFVRRGGGHFLSPPQYFHIPISVCTLLFGAHPRDYPETQQAYQGVIAEGGPANFYQAIKTIDEYAEILSVAQMLAYLRLSQWDSDLLMHLLEALIEKADQLNPSLRSDLDDALRQVWRNYYHMGEGRDVPFAIGHLFFAMDDFASAAEFFRHSLRLYGATPTTLYALAQAYVQLNEVDLALTALDDLLRLQPDAEAAHDLRAQLAKKTN